MRNFIIWTLSILLGFEPALWAEGRAEQQAMIKEFLQKSQVSQRQVSFQELFEKNADLLSASEKSGLPEFILQFGQQKLPKLEASKIKTKSGQEVYQLQGVRGGQSVTLEIINEGDVFARLNGQTLTMQDMRSLPTLMAKVGVPESDIKKYFDANSSRTTRKLLSARALQKLTPSDRIQYFQHLRRLLESMEAVEQFQYKSPTAQNSSGKWDVVLNWLQGTPALAGVVMKSGNDCVSAGWMARTAFDKSGRLKCGSDGAGGVDASFRGSCPNNKFQCNPTVYGSNQICVEGSRDTTKVCNDKVRGSDIPDLAQSGREFEELRQKAEAEAERVDAACKLDMSKAVANGKKGFKSGGNAYAGLDEDQKYTCGNFQKRYAEIQSWGCDKPDFKAKYVKLCKEEAATESQENPHPPAGPPSPSAAGGVDGGPGPTNDKGPVRCDQLPNNETVIGTACDGGNVSNKTTGVIKCLDGNVEKDIIECSCTSGSFVGKFKCGGGSKEAGHGGDDKDSGKSKKKGGFLSSVPTWLIVGGAGLLGLLLFHKLNKDAAKKQYQQMEPVPQSPPLTVPPITVPTPRGVS